MDVNVTRMSSKGQIVVPMHLRKRLGAKEGTLFAVAGTSDSLLLKKMHTPSKNELLAGIRKMARESGAILRTKGLKERDVIKMAIRGRGQ